MKKTTKTTKTPKMTKNRISLTRYETTYTHRDDDGDENEDCDTREIGRHIFTSIDELAEELAHLIATDGYSADSTCDITSLCTEITQDYYSGDHEEQHIHIQFGSNFNEAAAEHDLQVAVMNLLRSDDYRWTDENDVRRAVGLPRMYSQGSYTASIDKRIERPTLALVHSIAPTAVELMHRRIGLHSAKENGRSKERTANATAAALRLCKKTGV